jgi:hypothetical protein
VGPLVVTLGPGCFDILERLGAQHDRTIAKDRLGRNAHRCTIGERPSYGRSGPSSPVNPPDGQPHTIGCSAVGGHVRGAAAAPLEQEAKCVQ